MKKPGRRLYMAASVMVVTASICGIAGYQAINVRAEINQTERQNTDSGTEKNEQGFSEEGTTQMGTVSQYPEFTIGSVRMEVEEVYVEAGDTVKEGDALFKITDESMAEAIAYYEDAVADAEDVLETAEISYQTGKLEAEYEKQETTLEADSAYAELEAALLELDEEVQEKLDEWEQAQEDITTYSNSLNNNVYYTEAEIEEKTEAVSLAEAGASTAQAEYDTAKTAYEETKTVLETDIAALKNGCEIETWTEETIGTIKSLSNAVSNDYTAVNEAKAVLEEKQVSLSDADAMLQQAKQALEQAENEYEKNTKDAESKLEELNNNIGNLQSTYEEAVRNAETEKIDLQNDYDLAVLNGTYASSVYSNSVTTLEKEVEEAKINLEELQKEQAELLALEDGVVVAAQDGTISSVTYEAGDILNATAAFVTYCDTSVLTISVEVSQENIVKIAVGDTVAVTISGSRMGDLEGSVSSIASSATTGGSVSNVTYAVVISIDNSEGMLSSGTSASVMFQTASEIEMEKEIEIETETITETNEMTDTEN